MSLEGNVTTDKRLRGKINGLKTLRGYSAYEIALINGFEGTEAEWLESLHGSGGGGGEKAIHVIATLGNDGWQVDYTASEIFRTLENSGNKCQVYLHVNGSVLSLESISENRASFVETYHREASEDTTEGVLATWRFFGNDGILYMQERLLQVGGGLTDEQAAQIQANTKAIGDIETALDSILAIQNGLMGGDGA